MSTTFPQEMKDLRSQNWDLEYIEQHFLAKVLPVKSINRPKEKIRSSFKTSRHGQPINLYRLIGCY